MRTHNLTEGQDPERYAQLIQLQILLASKLRVLGKCGTLARVAGFVLSCLNFFF